MDSYVFAMNIVTTALAIFAIAALSLLISNNLAIQIFAQNKTGNMSKAAANMTKAPVNMTNATEAKKASLVTSNPPPQHKSTMQLICRGAACHVVAGCVECTK